VNTNTADLLIGNGVFRLDFSRRVTLSVLADIPHDQWCLQTVPGANHTLWTAGHLVTVDDMFLTHVGRQPSHCPEGWRELFGTGSRPAPDLAAYPAPAEVERQLAEIRERFLSWFRSLSEEELLAPVPEGFGRYARNVAEVAPSVAWHEAWHVGQLNLVRRSLGLGLKFG
jgi:hypothetical protein